MKKYRLLKDLPGVKAGTIYSKNANININVDNVSYLPEKVGCKHERFAIHQDYVESLEDGFFEPVDEPIEVSDVRYSGFNLGGGYFNYSLSTDKEIHPSLFDRVKKAVEFVINNTHTLSEEQEQEGIKKAILTPNRD